MEARPIDFLDAFAMLWSARRVKGGEAISIPERPQHGSRGLRMEMVARERKGDK